jgi:TM2 domain-containing membrane protein YozV
MPEKSKAEITEELTAEYRATIQRNAAEEDAKRREGMFRRGGAKSARVAYLFWFVLGSFGAHRFYLGRPISGAAMLALTAVAGLASMSPTLGFIGYLPAGVVFVWWLADAFLLPSMLP